MSSPLDPVPTTSRPAAFVLDAAIAVAWIVSARASEYANDVLHVIGRGTAAIVPASWQLQVAEDLLTEERRGRLTASELVGKLPALTVFPIQVDNQLTAHSLDAVLSLSLTRSVSVEKAAYLELASRLRLPLATANTSLIRTARAAGIPIYTP